jgi:hypothetical protein
MENPPSPDTKPETQKGFKLLGKIILDLITGLILG